MTKDLIDIQKLDRKTKETARIMYFGDYQLTDIAEKLNIDIGTIRFYVFGEDGRGENEKCWAYLKKQLNPASVAVYIKDKRSVLEKTAGISLNIINESLKRLDAELRRDPDFKLSVDDIKKLSSIVTEMDKMVRLESGSATELVEHIGLTVAEARRVLAEDDFAITLDADYTEHLDDEDKNEDVNHESGLELSGRLTSSLDGLAIPKPWK